MTSAAAHEPTLTTPAPAPDLLAAGDALAAVANGFIEAFEAWGHDARQARAALERWHAAAQAARSAS